MSKSFKEVLNDEYKKELEIVSCPIILGIENISIPSEDATLEEAEKIWPILEASLNLKHGYGLAAIQIGIPKKIAIVYYNEKMYRLLNTRIISTNSSIIIYNEGCLSIPKKTVHTERFATLKIQDDVLGELQLNMSKDGLLPIIFQHEIDHFNGQTILDRVRKPVQNPLKTGRNDPCPCGSGKKYKKCCLSV
jgi:peptide deformylase